MAEKQTEKRRRADQGWYNNCQYLRLVRPPVMSRAAQAQSTPGLVSVMMGSKVPS
jgi:hypothetical protein